MLGGPGLESVVDQYISVITNDGRNIVDVGLWLEEINLGGYRQISKENGVNGEYLESMSVFTTEQILRFIRRFVPTRTVYELVQEFMGVKKPDKINVKNPSGVTTKGLVPGDGDHGDGGPRDDGPGSVSV
ncbi:hypothetical protein Tco_0581808 [Tanacetum coccineum]